MAGGADDMARRSEEHTSELQSHVNLVCRPLRSTLFPYTTLFRSADSCDGMARSAVVLVNIHVDISSDSPRTASGDEPTERVCGVMATVCGLMARCGGRDGGWC